MFKTSMNLFNMASFDALAYILPKPFKCVRLKIHPKKNHLFLSRMYFPPLILRLTPVIHIFTATLITNINK